MATTYCDSFGYCYTENSWYIWGRWVLLGGLVLLAVAFCLCMSCMNKRRIKRGGAPMRYTGWTVPSYNQSQAQYGYPTNQPGGQNAYQMNNYPPYGQPGAQGAQGAYGQQGQYNYSQPTSAPTNTYAANAGHASNQAYYDATQTEAQNGVQPPAYPPPAKA